MFLGEQEHDAGFPQGALRRMRLQVDPDPQRFQNIGGAAFGGHGAVPMLGDGNACRRHDEGDGGELLVLLVHANKTLQKTDEDDNEEGEEDKGFLHHDL